ERINELEPCPVFMKGSEHSMGTPRQYYMANRWFPDNPNSRFPRVCTGFTPIAVLRDVWLSDASYFLIKTLQLRYTIRNVGKSIRNLRLYVNEQDAITFTKWEGLEPEREDNHAGNGGYPRMATYSFGIKATIL